MRKRESKSAVVANGYDDSIERAVLGAIILDNNRLEELATLLQPVDFFEGSSQIVYGSMLAMTEAGLAIDLVTLRDRLRSEARYDAVGGAMYLESLLEGLPQSTNVMAYARRIKEQANRRRILSVSSRVQKEENSGKTSEEIMQEIERELSDIRNGAIQRGCVPVASILPELEPSIERIESGGNLMGEATGFAQLDGYTGGLASGAFWILGGRPSDGKTSFALNLVLNMAKRGVPCAFFSLETMRDTLLMMMACIEGEVNYQRLRVGEYRPGDIARLRGALSMIATLPIFVDDTAYNEPERLRFAIRSISQRRNIRFAVVDYLQRMNPGGDGRYEQVTKISLVLSAAAKDMGQISGGTLMALSQLSRPKTGEARSETWEPGLTDLKESGQIEQDADVVLFIFRNIEREKNGEGTDQRLLKLAKQKTGPLGNIGLNFREEYTKFSEIVRDGEQRQLPEDEWRNAQPEPEVAFE